MNSKTTKTKKPTKIVGASAAPRGTTAVYIPTKLAKNVSGFLGKGGDISAFTCGVLKGVVNGANA